MNLRIPVLMRLLRKDWKQLSAFPLGQSGMRMPLLESLNSAGERCTFLLYRPHPVHLGPVEVLFAVFDSVV